MFPSLFDKNDPQGPGFPSPESSPDSPSFPLHAQVVIRLSRTLHDSTIFPLPITDPSSTNLHPPASSHTHIRFPPIPITNRPPNGHDVTVLSAIFSFLPAFSATFPFPPRQPMLALFYLLFLILPTLTFLQHTTTNVLLQPSILQPPSPDVSIHSYIMAPPTRQIIRHKDKFNNAVIPKPHEIETITTFHNFNFDTHEDAPLYYLTLRALHPFDLLRAGIAHENTDGTIHAEPLTAQTISDILQTTFEHHMEHKLNDDDYFALQLVQINQRPISDTDKKDMRGQTYFTLYFRQDPTITDAIDSTLILDQLRTLVWADWLHNDITELNRRHQLNCLTTPLKYTDKVPINPPSNSPWVPYLNLYIPACNHYSDRAAGILTGIPISTQYFDNRRFLVYLNNQIHTILYDFLPTVMKDFTIFSNLIGLQSGKFTSSAPLKLTSSLTYVAASDSDQFTHLYLAQHRYFQATKKQAIEIYGLTIRIISLPPTSTKGLQIRTQLHHSCTALAKRFNRYVKLPIPYELFLEPVDEKTIHRILQTTYVEAVLPYFHDETQPEPDHYVLFLLSNFETIYITIHSLYRTLKDFPRHIIKLPPAPVKQAPTQEVAAPKPVYHDYFDDDLAFLQQLANIDTPTSPQINSITSEHPSDDHSIPQQITTTKRPHHPTGATITPQRQKAKNRPTQGNAPGSFHPSFHPPDSMEVEHPIHTTEDSNTSTSELDSNSLEEHQRETPQFTPTHLPSEYIPDDQYAFDPSHSQQTRLEIMDTLATAKALSHRHYQKTLEYVTSHKHVDVDHLKNLTKVTQRARNESKAPPTHTK